MQDLDPNSNHSAGPGSLLLSMLEPDPYQRIRIPINLRASVSTSTQDAVRILIKIKSLVKYTKWISSGSGFLSTLILNPDSCKQIRNPAPVKQDSIAEKLSVSVYCLLWKAKGLVNQLSVVYKNTDTVFTEANKLVYFDVNSNII